MKLKPIRLDLRVAFIYALFGCLWILFSDRLLGMLVTDRLLILEIQTYKGWAFVLLSALVIFFLMRRELLQLQLAEKILRASEEQYRLLFESNPLPMWVYELETLRFLAVNEAAIHKYGYSKAEFLGMCLKDIRPQDDLLRLLQNVAETTDASQSSGPWKHQTKDGRILFVEIISHSLSYFGQTARLVMVNDITERKLAEDQSRIVTEELKSAQAFSHIGNWLWDIKANKVTWSDEMYRIFGIEKDGFTGNLSEVISQAIHPDDRAHVDQANLSVSNDGKPIPLEYRIIHPDGAIRAVWAEASELIRDESGAPAFLKGIVQDITQRKQAEASLHLQSAALEAAANAIVITDVTGAIQWVNPAWSELTGYPLAQAIGQNPRLLKSGIQEESFYKNLWNTILAGNTWRGELVNKRQDGTLYTEEETITPVRNEQGQVEHFIAIKQDITRRKQADAELRAYRDHLEDLVRERTAELEIAKNQAEAANRAKSDFLSIMSHEIRTPLNGVLGMTHLAQQTDLNEKQREYLRHIQTSGEILRATINDILDFSKIEAGKLSLEMVSFDLDDVLDNLSTLVAYHAQEKGLELIFKVGSEIPRLMIGDPMRLEQVLINLVGNAIKFTDAGEIIVNARLVNKTASHVELEFSVVDSGIGITEAQMANLFQPFNQADTSISRKYGGTGLGLTISQWLVNMMGGEINVESKFGSGTTFIFRATFQRQPESANEVFNAPQEFNQLCALVVSEHPYNLEFMQNALESFSFRVVAAHSAESGMELLNIHAEKEPFDLIILDQGLHGEIPGLQAVFRIRENPRFEKTPLIQFVNQPEPFSDTADASQSIFLVKPVTRSHLFDAIMQLLGYKTANSKKSTAKLALDLGIERLKGKHILLVEDNEINQLVAVELLHGLGLSVSLANNGDEALQLVDKGQFDAILMDIQMPGMDGYQTTAKIRMDPRFTAQNLPIIAMTAHAMAGYREKVLEAGLNDYVAKPVDVSYLTNTLLRWLSSEPASDKTPSQKPESAPEALSVEILSTLNTKSALERLNHNQTLYLRILKVFEQDQANVIDKLRLAIQQNELDQARLLAHSLKGSAGTLGADGLSEAAKKLEHAIAQNDHSAFEMLLADVENRIAAVLAAIATL